jgi:RNA polymerase sigma factor (sigma-70 family)
MSEMVDEERTNALRTALESIFEQKKERLLRYAYFTLRKTMPELATWDEAKELLSSALVEVLRDIQNRPENMSVEEGPLTAWIQRNLIYEAREFARRNKRRKLIAQRHSEGSESTFSDEHVLFKAVEPAGIKTPEYELMLHTIYKDLKSDDKTLFGLLVNENLPSSEVARRLGISNEAVRKRKQRLLNKIKERLSQTTF